MEHVNSQLELVKFLDYASQGVHVMQNHQIVCPNVTLLNLKHFFI